MIEGQINSQDEAIVRLAILGSDGEPIDADLVVDSGFSGYLALPRSLIQKLRYMPDGEEDVLLADGSETIIPVVRLTVIWDGKKRTVTTFIMDGKPLIGMKLMRGCLVTMEVTRGGEVTIESIE